MSSLARLLRTSNKNITQTNWITSNAFSTVTFEDPTWNMDIGDLYPVTKPSHVPSALLYVSPATWHQRLGYPGAKVLRSLISRNFISCNKENSSHICHAFQLGKHVKLPFVTLDTRVSSSFDIIHFDIWTYPIGVSCNTGGNRTSQRDVTQSCSIKTFRASGGKKFISMEGVVGLLTRFESIESVLHITKYPAESQVEFAPSMLQGRALTWWNTLVQTRGRQAAIAQPWEDFKKLLMEEYCSDDEGAVSIANRLTTNGIKDGLFKKKENARNKRRSNDQNMNQGRDHRNKRQRTGKNFGLTAPKQGHGQRQYAGQHPKCAKCNFHHS
nr:ribonuclease H-like domain-containing protein [Tanacetum cinerariifolium]